MAGDDTGYRLYTIDHETGQERLDLQQQWADTAAPEPIRHEDDLLCDPFEVRSACHWATAHGEPSSWQERGCSLPAWR